MNPPKGLLLYNRINQYTLDLFYRDPNGRETMLPGQSIVSSLNNFQDMVLDTANAVTTANGFFSYWPRIPDSYIGRAKISATASFKNVSTLIESLATDVSYDAVGCEMGLFGVVPEQDAGLVRITPLDAALSPVDISLVNGTFCTPELGGSQRQVRRDPDGSPGPCYFPSIHEGRERVLPAAELDGPLGRSDGESGVFQEALQIRNDSHLQFGCEKS